MTKTITLSIPNIRCGICARTIENTLTQLSFIRETYVDIVEQRVTIEIDELETPHLQEIEIKEVLLKTGFESCDLSGEEGSSHQEDIKTQLIAQSLPSTSPPTTKQIIRTHWRKGLIALLLGGGMLALTLFSGGIPLILLYLMASISTVATLYFGKETYVESYKKLTQTKKLTMDSLFTVSTLVAIGTSLLSLFMPWLHLPLLFDAALLIFGFRHMGQAIEEKAKQKIIEGLHFRSRVPELVEISESDVKAPVKKLKPGHIIVIRPGQLIPVDGKLIEIIGDAPIASVYNTIITGNILPSLYKRNDLLLAGMRLAEDSPPLRVEVMKSEANSYLARLDQNILKTCKEKSELETTVNRIMQYFIPTVFLVAAVVGLVVGLFCNPLLAVQSAITILVSSCPCAFGFVVPLAIKIGIAKAAEHGVQFKNGKMLQAMNDIDTVVFDLNGTLTQGKPIVKEFYISAENRHEKKKLLAIAEAMESNSKNLIGKAIKAYATANLLSSPREMKSIEPNQPSSGVRAMIDNQEYSIGDQTLMDQSDIDTSRFQHQINTGSRIIYLTRGKQVIAYFEVNDPLREEAERVVKTLQKMNKHVYLCTGADRLTALHYAKQLNIPSNHVMAKCVGNIECIETGDQISKPKFIQQLKNAGKKVAMVGEGGNDAVAIIQADVGVAVQSTSLDEVTQNNAGVVIKNNSLLSILTAFTVAKQAVRNIKQNLVFSLAYNLTPVIITCVLVMLVGMAINPALGVALMILQSVLLLSNAYRFKRQAIEHMKLAENSKTTINNPDMFNTRNIHKQLNTEPRLICALNSDNPNEDEQKSQIARMTTPEIKQEFYPASNIEDSPRRVLAC